MKKSIFPIAITAIMIAASCTKKDNAAQVQTANNSSSPKTQIISAQSGFPSLSLMSGMRKYDPKVNKDDCFNDPENCHPEDIVISSTNFDRLIDAIKGGGAGVAQLFSDNERAVGLIPEWGDEWFADVKNAIKSGNYTFLKTGESTFVLGKEGRVSEDNFEYAISYDVQ